MAIRKSKDPSPLVYASHLSKTYGATMALNNLNLKIWPGEFFGLLGPNGSGKTTTIHVLSTLIKPDNGKVRIAGLNPTTNSIAIRKKIGLVFQERTVDNTLTVKQNLYFAGQLHGLSKKSIDKNIAPLLSLFGLENSVNRPVASLSGGLKRAVDIIRGIIHQPDILILDEPTIGLDLPNRLRIWKFIKDLQNSSGLTVILTTHYLDEAEPCDNVGFINSGRIIREGNPQNLVEELSNYVLEFCGKQMMKNRLIDILGNHLDIDGTIYFKCSDKNLNLVTQLHNEFREEIEAWQIRRPTLNDVFLWTMKKAD